MARVRFRYRRCFRAALSSETCKRLRFQLRLPGKLVSGGGRVGRADAFLSSRSVLLTEERLHGCISSGLRRREDIQCW